jgi:pyrroloquinoline quinone biosynthesis protein B
MSCRRNSLSLSALLLAACTAPPAQPPASPAVETPAPSAVTGPRVVAVGTVQDGGLPHAACRGPHCEAARRDPARRRRVASLAIVVPRGEPADNDAGNDAGNDVFLIDATPDLVEQLHTVAAWRRPSNAPGGFVDRRPLSGVFLTHAHMGHYLGLAHFGFEAVHTRGLPTWASPRMAEYLSANGPWEQLVTMGNLDLRRMPLAAPGVPADPAAWVELGGGVAVAAFPVPHRDEYSDTLAYLVRGPRTTLLYVPDTDGWERWQRPLPEVLADGVDVALLDGTFYSMDELPGRDITAVRHPLITATMDLLAPRVTAGEVEVFFTHLNHSNPALEPDGAARKAIEERGFRVLEEGWEVGL